MSEMTFAPSEVFPFFPHSPLVGEQEAIAAMVVSFLASNGDNWNEFQWPEFMRYTTKDELDLPAAYIEMFRGQFTMRTLNHIGAMVRDEYLLYRKDEQTNVEYLQVGPKLKQFYQGYLKLLPA